MYCQKCGVRQGEGARFCHACGSARVEPPAPQRPQHTIQVRLSDVQIPLPKLSAQTGGAVQGTTWRTVARAGAIAMLIGFFLPWVSVSCNAQTMRTFGIPPSSTTTLQFSGFDLAAGPKVQTPMGVQQLPASVGLWLIVAAAVAVLIITVVVMAQRTGAVAVLGTGLLSMAPLFNTWQSFEQSRTPYTDVGLQIGLWLTLLGLTGVGAGGVVGLSAPPESVSSSAPGQEPAPYP